MKYEEEGIQVVTLETARSWALSAAATSHFNMTVAVRRGQQRAIGLEGTHTSWEDDPSSLIGSTPQEHRMRSETKPGIRTLTLASWFSHLLAV